MIAILRTDRDSDTPEHRQQDECLWWMVRGAEDRIVLDGSRTIVFG